jgi:undecaprenyl-diphosphatase
MLEDRLTLNTIRQVHMKAIDSWDAYATSSINSLAGHVPWLDGVIVVIAHIGVPLLELAVIANWWPRSESRSERHAVVACGLSFLLGLALNQIVASVMHRARPYDVGVTHLLIGHSVGPSFPADHATMTFAIVFTYLFGARLRKATGFMIGAIVIVFSHIYAGTHYVSDIVGGAATGCVAAGFVKILYKERTGFDRLITGIF